MTSPRYYMYLRKSNESDEKQGLSIPAQEDSLRKIVAQRGLTVVGEPLRESQSAKVPGRPLFTQMLAGIKAGKADGILCWHLDRLSRNPYDEMQIKCGLLDGTIKEVVTPDRTYHNTPDDGLMSSLIFAMATKYSQDLAVNIKGGNRAALERGFLPGKPKLGYRRDPVTNQLVPDEGRFHRVREIWLLRLAGLPVSEILRRAREEWGLTTPPTRGQGGKLISHSGIWRLLGDPFYAGVISRKEGTFEGSHPPMITWTEYKKVQGLVRKEVPQAGPRNRLHPFTYRGLLNCGRCGALVTAEYTTNRYGKKYIHWHCTRKKRTYIYCPERSIEEKAPEAELDAFFGSLRLPNDLSEVIVDEIDYLKSESQKADEEANTKRAQELQRIDQRLRRLRDMCADGLIETEEFNVDRQALLSLKMSLEENGKPGVSLQRLELLKEAVSLANLAQFRFRAGDREKKREILQAVASNLTIKDRSLFATAKEPIATYVRFRDNPQMCSWRDTIRTLVN